MHQQISTGLSKKLFPTILTAVKCDPLFTRISALWNIFKGESKKLGKKDFLMKLEIKYTRTHSTLPPALVQPCPTSSKNY